MGLDSGLQGNGSSVVSLFVLALECSHQRKSNVLTHLPKVDTDTKVYGTDNLFVVDASIFPAMISK